MRSSALSASRCPRGKTTTSSSETSCSSPRPRRSIRSVTDRNARSSSSTRSRSASSSLEYSRTVSSTAGWRSWNTASASEMSTGPMVCITPRVTRPRWTPRTDSSSASAASTSARTRRARATSSRPASVIVARRVRPVDKLETNLLLEPADLLRHRRLRDVLAFCRSGEIPLLSERDEVPELPQFHKDSL